MCHTCHTLGFVPAQFCSAHCVTAAQGAHSVYHVPPGAPRSQGGVAPSSLVEGDTQTASVVQSGVDTRRQGNHKLSMKVLRRGRSAASGALDRAILGYELALTMQTMKSHRREAAQLFSTVAGEFEHIGAMSAWALSLARAFLLLAATRNSARDCPLWWNESALWNASLRACRAEPASPLVWDMRGTVLCGGNSLLWNVTTPRTAHELRLASLCFMRAAHLYADDEARKSASERALFAHDASHEVGRSS